MTDCLINASARSRPSPTGLFEPGEYDLVTACYRSAQRTPLLRLPHLATKLGVGDILVKDESQREGLNAFKILGVRFAIRRLLDTGALAGDPVLVCATDGNHGRALARTARELGLRARIYVPDRMVPARRKAIAGEGAELVVVDGTYDEAVRSMARDAAARGDRIVSDTAWPGYEEIPRWIMAGYTQLLEEAAAQWSPGPAPDVVLVQGGVGGLACAVVSWLCHRYGDRRPFTIVCEPAAAACLLESARAGKPVTARGNLDTIMACLDAGEVSSLAWPILHAAADAFVAIEDDRAVEAMRAFANPQGGDPPVTSGESGSCGLAALLAILSDENLRELRAAARLGPGTRVLLLNTEGAVDPESFRRIVGDSTPSALCSSTVSEGV